MARNDATGKIIAISREPEPKGDRVRVVLSGKFLPHKVD